jgi:hypothetical protein
MRKLIRNTDEVLDSLQFKSGKILDIEKAQRVKLKNILRIK